MPQIVHIANMSMPTGGVGKSVQLPSGISEQTLLAYEHGPRQLTALRLIELCGTLGVDAPAVFARALQRTCTYIEALPLKVDLHALLNDRSPTYRPLAQWAQNTLNEHPDGVVGIPPEVVKNLALFMGCTSEQLARYLPEKATGKSTG